LDVDENFLAVEQALIEFGRASIERNLPLFGRWLDQMTFCQSQYAPLADRLNIAYANVEPSILAALEDKLARKLELNEARAELSRRYQECDRVLSQAMKRMAETPSAPPPSWDARFYDEWEICRQRYQGMLAEFRRKFCGSASPG
jgi:hypothetical protein